MSPYPPPVRDPNAGLRQAGTAAIWVWVALGLIPLAVLAGCFWLCLVGMVTGHSGTAPTP